MRQCNYCGKEYPDDVNTCPIDSQPLQRVGARFPEPQPAEAKGAWNKDLSGYIWPWLEPVLGVPLVFDGIKIILNHEYHDHLLFIMVPSPILPEF
jgi:hypothetical protein